MVLSASCKIKEPSFMIKGDKWITKDLKVNVELLKQDSAMMATTYYNGKSYEIKNQSTLRYVIYVSFKDSLFYQYEMDNLHGEVKGEPINEITVKKKDSKILVLYKSIKGRTDYDDMALQPWNIFIEKAQHTDTEKEKFTAFYKP